MMVRDMVKVLIAVAGFAALVLTVGCGSNERSLARLRRRLRLLRLRAATVAPAAQELPFKQWDEPPAMMIDMSNDITAVIELEKGGEIVIDLFEKRGRRL